MDIGKWEQAKRWLTRPVKSKTLKDYHDDSSVDRGYGVGYRPRSIPDNFVPVMPQAPGLQDPATSIKELATGGRVGFKLGGNEIIAAYNKAAELAGGNPSIEQVRAATGGKPNIYRVREILKQAGLELAKPRGGLKEAILKTSIEHQFNSMQK